MRWKTMVETEAMERLVEDLVADLQPVRSFRLGPALAALLGVEVLAVWLAVFVFGVRPDISSRAIDPGFVASAAVLAGVAAASGWAALRLAIPGRDLSSSALVTLLCLPVFAALAVLVLLPWGATWLGMGPVIAGCSRCIASTVATALIPWLMAVAIVARLAPLRPLRTAVFAGLSAFAIGALGTQMHCRSDDAYHLAMGHYLPVLVLAVVSGLVVARFLRVGPVDVDDSSP